jgi:peptidyl-prolyl cis-trans isomerase C
MSCVSRRWAVTLALLAAPALAPAQETLPTPAGTKPAAPAGPAAVVNGQPIPESAVQRGLRGVPPTEAARARAEVLDYLIDNTLIDQFLQQQKVEAPAKEVDERLGQIQAELKKNNQDYAKMLAALALTEAEIKQQIAADLRWEKYATSQTNDAALKEMFEQNKEMFDSSMVRARHILLKAPADPAQANAKLVGYKKQVEDAAAAEVAKLPAGAASADAARAKKAEEVFSAIAREASDCPSKKDGGDLSWFPRAGSMVEPFAKAAFALKTGQISDPVQTPFGTHLILVTDRKAGMPVKFEDVKDAVFAVWCVRLRDGLLAKLKPAAKVTITPAKG